MSPMEKIHIGMVNYLYKKGELDEEEYLTALEETRKYHEKKDKEHSN